MINSLIGIPFKNKHLAEGLVKNWLKETKELTYFIEKDKYSTIYKCKKKEKEDLLFHVILKQIEEVDSPAELKTENDYKQLIAAEKCSVSLFIFKGKEDDFKYFAYNLLEIMLSYSDEEC